MWNCSCTASICEGFCAFALTLTLVFPILLIYFCCRKIEPECAKLLDADDTPVCQLSDRNTKPPDRVDGLCVIAADPTTLSTIAEQVREATSGFYTVEKYLVTNRKAVADLPIYTRAICCVRNAERNISFNNQGEPEPEADLGFHAFHRMDSEQKTSTGPSGVIIILVNHANSQDSSKLCSMEDTALKDLSPRLRKLAGSDRFLTVDRDKKLNAEQRAKLTETCTWTKL